jgi:hypothetical protein
MASKSQGELLRRVPISWGRRRVCERTLSIVPCLIFFSPCGEGDHLPFIGQGEGDLQAWHTISLRVVVWRTVLWSRRPS